MEKILISDFKAKCIAILRRVNATRQPVLITRRGVPIARIEPAATESPRRLGQLRGQVEILGDIVQTDSTEDWEVLNGTSS